MSGVLKPSLQGFAVFTALCVLVSLGFWQLHRKEWKEGLMASLSLRSSQAGVPLEKGFSQHDHEFIKVRFSGRPLEGKHAFVYDHLPSLGAGALVFVPVELETGDVVFVNRGFVPQNALGAFPSFSDVVEVEGILRWPEMRGVFTPSEDLTHNLWYGRDIGSMAAGKGLKVLPFYVDLIAPVPSSGFPMGGGTRISLKNNHLEYALTWFGLALALVSVYAAFVIQKHRVKA